MGDLLPVGAPVPGWTPRALPTGQVLEGRHCRLEPLEPRHADGLHAADLLDASGAGWTYLAYGPFPDLADYRRHVADAAVRPDRLFYAVLAPGPAGDSRPRAVGVASYLRMQPTAGSIEVGALHFSPLLQRTTAATEAHHLLMRHVFDDLGYRRYEWKCDALNAPSRAAAERLGFTYEGTFRQADVVKGRNRDTAWFSILDHEWPRARRAFEAWLAPDNFGADGRQRARLQDLRGA